MGQYERECSQHMANSKPWPFLRSKPLQIWEKEVRNGHIKRITYSDIRSSVLEIMSELCVGDHVDQHIDDVRHLPLRREQNARDQAPVSRHDNQEFEKVFYLRGSGA